MRLEPKTQDKIPCFAGYTIPSTLGAPDGKLRKCPVGVRCGDHHLIQAPALTVRNVVAPDAPDLFPQLRLVLLIARLLEGGNQIDRLHFLSFAPSAGVRLLLKGCLDCVLQWFEYVFATLGIVIVQGMLTVVLTVGNTLCEQPPCPPFQRRPSFFCISHIT